MRKEFCLKFSKTTVFLLKYISWKGKTNKLETPFAVEFSLGSKTSRRILVHALSFFLLRRYLEPGPVGLPGTEVEFSFVSTTQKACDSDEDTSCTSFSSISNASLFSTPTLEYDHKHREQKLKEEEERKPSLSVVVRYD